MRWLHAGNPKVVAKAMVRKEDLPNQALYDQVISLHDEVMPKMEDIYKSNHSYRRKSQTRPTVAERKSPGTWSWCSTRPTMP